MSFEFKIGVQGLRFYDDNDRKAAVLMPMLVAVLGVSIV
jgi:hypothetical protein